MEIGSFIELEFPSGKEYYSGDLNIARLNSGRAAIWHAFRLLQCNCLWLPYYQCDTVRAFLKRKNVQLKFYHIDAQFEPIGLDPASDEAVLFVNYYGIMSVDRMCDIAKKYKHVIIDNSQAFFAAPVLQFMNVYSARKFVGVPDGAYVIGNEAHRFVEEYSQGVSSDTANFLLQRIEYGCEGKTYTSRMVNEHRIDTEDIMQMSVLTRRILDGADYATIQAKRTENFRIANTLFADINKLDSLLYFDVSCVPMVYPLLIEDDTVLDKLLQNKHFQGHWWSYLLNEMEPSTAEYWLSRYMVPITIDQRYGVKELEFLREVIG